MQNYFPKYAGFWKRFIAHLIDIFILGIVKSTLLLPIYIFLGISLLDFEQLGEHKKFVSAVYSLDSDSQITTIATFIFFIAIAAVVSIVLEWLYFALMESSLKQATLGKMVLRIKVTDSAGNRISFGKASGRHFGKYLSGLFLLIGYIMAGFTEHKQALHDLLAGCFVVNQDYFIHKNLESES